MSVVCGDRMRMGLHARTCHTPLDATPRQQQTTTTMDDGRRRTPPDWTNDEDDRRRGQETDVCAENTHVRPSLLLLLWVGVGWVVGRMGYVCV